MISYLNYRSKLSTLQEQLDKYAKNHKEEIKKAKKENKSDMKLQLLADEFNHFYAYYEGEIRVLTSDYYISKAEKKLIPIPDPSDTNMWEEVNFRTVLTLAGIKKVRSDLRKNQKEINEIFLPYITILIGLLGAISGLVAVLSK